MEENINKAMEEYEHRKNKKKIDPAQFKKFSNDFLGKIIKTKLSEGECASKGYNFKNFPKNYKILLIFISILHNNKEKKIKKLPMK